MKLKLICSIFLLCLICANQASAALSKEEKKNLSFLAQQLKTTKASIDKGKIDSIREKYNIQNAFVDYEKGFDYLNKNTLEFQSLEYQIFHVLSKIRFNKNNQIENHCFDALETPFSPLKMLNKYAKINKYCITDTTYLPNQIIIDYAFNGAYFGKHIMHSRITISYQPQSKAWYLAYADMTDEMNKIMRNTPLTIK